MSEESPAPAAAAPDPLHSRFGELEQRLRDQPDALAEVVRELAATGWATESGPAGSDPLVARCCLAVADALAAQAYTLDVGYAWRAESSEHLFRVAARPPLVLGLEGSFLSREIGPERARLYVETLMRPLREAAKAGSSLAVAAGALERRPLPADPPVAPAD